jgi:hypothetical protein
MAIILDTWKAKIRKSVGPGQPGQKPRPYLQNNQSKRAGGMAQVVECLPSTAKK